MSEVRDELAGTAGYGIIVTGVAPETLPNTYAGDIDLASNFSTTFGSTDSSPAALRIFARLL